MSQSPSLRGSGRFRRAQRISPPSREVSIPFIAGQWSLPADASAGGGVCGTGLNPLHCGAVVASRKAGSGGAESRRVSIPFIAGQWSLPGGAAGVSALARRVSIPFIAGQWSLRAGGSWCAMIKNLSQSPSLRGSGRFGSAGAEGSGGASSQSPSLRGSGRFSSRTAGGGKEEECLNPLHCGAVVASHPTWLASRRRSRSQSPSLRGSGRFARRAHDDLLADLARSQSPSLRGSGRFWLVASAARRAAASSQSPSLRGSGRFQPAPKPKSAQRRSLNPLHCGAVVASPRLGWIGLDLTPPCLNPLHCGAVVASNFGVYRSKWGAESQSPSLRGSGRFGPHEAPRRHRLLRLNPLHCGAVVASRRLGPRFGRRSKVSIPFIAGQWSLLR